ncbi:hypothetical protein LXA43DRAFT_981229 [Ganoderma leucocontextum]|nr:hypothetical protein LXA43DRAFT_981229 [Ganoderma leucocontextum]
MYGAISKVLTRWRRCAHNHPRATLQRVPVNAYVKCSSPPSVDDRRATTDRRREAPCRVSDGPAGRLLPLSAGTAALRTGARCLFPDAQINPQCRAFPADDAARERADRAGAGNAGLGAVMQPAMLNTASRLTIARAADVRCGGGVRSGRTPADNLNQQSSRCSDTVRCTSGGGRLSRRCTGARLASSRPPLSSRSQGGRLKTVFTKPDETLDSFGHVITLEASKDPGGAPWGISSTKNVVQR